jgi:hypothetical protein
MQWSEIAAGEPLLAISIDDVTCIGHDASGGQHVARWPAGA